MVTTSPLPLVFTLGVLIIAEAVYSAVVLYSETPYSAALTEPNKVKTCLVKLLE